MRRDDLRRREPKQPVLRWTGPDGRASEYALSNGRPATIGREAKNTIALNSPLVSKAHALVEFRDGEYTIQDLESANGTRVNDEATSVRVLEPGDRIGVGDIELTFLDLDPEGGGAGGAAASGTAKAIELALTAVVTLLVMLGLLYALLGSSSGPARAGRAAEEALAAAPPELLARLRAAAEGSVIVKDVVQRAAMAGVTEAQALHEEGRMRLETERWRDAAMLLAAAVTRDRNNARAQAAFADAAAHLDRAASKALAAAEMADFGMRYDDALLHADEVLQLIERDDPRYDRAQKIAEHARATARLGK
ncbi:MAG: FHA domain-containing protein [Acidobacteriota bacterium]